MQFDREELLSALSDASPALAKSSTIPGLDHFWFDGKYIYAYDGGLGVRITFKSELECGLPGRVLLDLLKTSALKEVDVSLSKDDVTLKLGKSTINVVSLDLDRLGWPKEWAVGKKGNSETIKLTEAVLDAITRVGFCRLVGKPKGVIPQVTHRGITVLVNKDSLDFYATDSRSIARVTVKGKPSIKLARFILPWEFVDQLLVLAKPDATLHVREDSLMLEGNGVLLCSNALELHDDPNLSKVIGYHLRDDEDTAGELPAGMQRVLEQAIILGGKEEGETFIEIALDGKNVNLSGKYKLGSLDEALPIKNKMTAASGVFNAQLLRRALGQAKMFIIDERAIALDDDENFVYVQATMTKENAKEKKVKRTARTEDDDDRPAKVSRRQSADDDDDTGDGDAPRQRRGRRIADDEIPF